MFQKKKEDIIMLSPKLQQVNLQPAMEIRGWQQFLDEGEAFLKTASGALSKKREVFTADILYNIISMAIEKFVMAALMRAGTMPYNHTMADLVAAMEETFPGVLADIRERLLDMDRYQEICDLEDFSITPPDMDEIPGMLEVAERLRMLVTSHAPRAAGTLEQVA